MDIRYLGGDGLDRGCRQSGDVRARLTPTQAPSRQTRARSPSAQVVWWSATTPRKSSPTPTIPLAPKRTRTAPTEPTPRRCRANKTPTTASAPANPARIRQTTPRAAPTSRAAHSTSVSKQKDTHRSRRTRIAAGAHRTRPHAVDHSSCGRRSSLRRDGPCPNCPLTAGTALPFSFLSPEPSRLCVAEANRRAGSPRGACWTRGRCACLCCCLRSQAAEKGREDL